LNLEKVEVVPSRMLRVRIPQEQGVRSVFCRTESETAGTGKPMPKELESEEGENKLAKKGE